MPETSKPQAPRTDSQMNTTANPPKRRVGRPRRRASSVQIHILKEAGWSFRKIARSLDLGYGTIRRVYFSSSQEKQTATTDSESKTAQE